MLKYHLTASFELDNIFLENPIKEKELRRSIEALIEQKTSSFEIVFTEETKGDNGWRNDDLSSQIIKEK